MPVLLKRHSNKAFHSKYHSFLEIFAVVGPIHLVGPRLVEVEVIVWSHDAQAFFLLSIGTLYQLNDNTVQVPKISNKELCHGHDLALNGFDTVDGALSVLICRWPDSKCGSSSRSHSGSPPLTSPAGSSKFCHRLALHLCWTEFQSISPGRCEIKPELNLWQTGL